MRHLLVHNVFIACSLLLPMLAFALPSDRHQPINITSDSAQMDEEKKTTTYQGEAVLIQGTLKIEGDTIIFYYDNNKQIVKAVAKGKPAKYQQLQAPGEQPVRARALQMEYYAQSQKIYLLDEGYVWDNGDVFTGNRIEYDIRREEVVAHSAPPSSKSAKKERVHVIIQPSTAEKTAPSVTSQADPSLP